MSDAYASEEDARRYVAERRRSPWRRLSKRIETWRVLRAAGAPLRAVDVACGSGRYPAVASCDASPGMAALARAAGRRAVRADARALPFAGGTFDTAFCVRLLHHLETGPRRAVLGELRRVAGAAVVTYFGATGAKARRRRAKGRRTRRAASAAEFLADCAAAGWRVVSDRAVVPGWSEQRVVRLEPLARP